MYFAAYHFDGDADRLYASYERMLTTQADQAILNLCVVREDGITVYDTCPTREDFESFSTGDEFRSALKDAGLPAPRLEPLGEVRSAVGVR